MEKIFEIKAGYYLKLLMLGTMILLGSTEKKKINKKMVKTFLIYKSLNK